MRGLPVAAALFLLITGCTTQSLRESFYEHGWRHHEYGLPVATFQITDLVLDFNKMEIREAQETEPFLDNHLRDSIEQAYIRDYFVQELNQAGFLASSLDTERVLKCSFTEASGEFLKSWVHSPIPFVYLATYFVTEPEARVELRLKCRIDHPVWDFQATSTGVADAAPWISIRDITSLAFERAVDAAARELIPALLSYLEELEKDDQHRNLEKPEVKNK